MPKKCNEVCKTKMECVHRAVWQCLKDPAGCHYRFEIEIENMRHKAPTSVGAALELSPDTTWDGTGENPHYRTAFWERRLAEAMKTSFTFDEILVERIEGRGFESLEQLQQQRAMTEEVEGKRICQIDFLIKVTTS
jgi:hypothetical protein